MKTNESHVELVWIPLCWTRCYSSHPVWILPIYRATAIPFDNVEWGKFLRK